MPKRMTMRLVCTAVFWVNLFPQNKGVSDTVSPQLLMSGIKPSTLHAKHQFGEHFQTHKTSTNDMKS